MILNFSVGVDVLVLLFSICLCLSAMRHPINRFKTLMNSLLITISSLSIFLVSEPYFVLDDNRCNIAWSISLCCYVASLYSFKFWWMTEILKRMGKKLYKSGIPYTMMILGIGSLTGIAILTHGRAIDDTCIVSFKSLNIIIYVSLGLILADLVMFFIEIRKLRKRISNEDIATDWQNEQKYQYLFKLGLLIILMFFCALDGILQIVFYNENNSEAFIFILSMDLLVNTFCNYLYVCAPKIVTMNSYQTLYILCVNSKYSPVAIPKSEPRAALETSIIETGETHVIPLELNWMTRQVDIDLVQIFGGINRIQRLQEHFHALKTANVRLGILSHNYQHIIKHSLELFIIFMGFQFNDCFRFEKEYLYCAIVLAV